MEGAVDQVLAQWRARLAAASRNVSELSELPEYAAAREAARGQGHLADEARKLVATMDELWQGVLLIGAALDRADAARKAGTRLWRGEAAAQEALAILNGPSITVDLAETPVLHRRLLAGPRATATVSPETLLQTMDAAFDRARERLTTITQARSRAAALRAKLLAMLPGLPGADLFASELADSAHLDELDRLAVLEALWAKVDLANRARTGLTAARAALAALRAADAAAHDRADLCRANVLATLPSVDRQGLVEMSAWLEQIAHTAESGRAPAALVGLANWQTLHDRLAGEIRALDAAAGASIARADDLAARFGALRAKHRARATNPHLDSLAAAVKERLTSKPIDLEITSKNLALYEGALTTRA